MTRPANHLASAAAGHGQVSTRRRFRAFTLVELLVAIAVILVLLAILSVAIASASRSAQKTNTQALMNSMKQALVRFHADIGYYPPVLGVKTHAGNANPAVDLYRKLWDYRGDNFSQDGAGQSFAGDDIHPDNGAYAAEAQFWYSITSPAEYLIGPGNHREDGYGVVAGAVNPFDWEAETPPTGIRHPWDDGVWGASFNGAANGQLAARMRDRPGGAAFPSENAPMAFDQGEVYGPYLELKDERLIGAVNGTQLNPTTGQYEPVIVYPGDVANFDALPKVVVDYWGKPIRYYRRPYPPGAIGQSYRAGLDLNNDGNPYNDRVPKLSDFFVLRPFNITAGADVQGLVDSAGDNGTTAELENGEFALFSEGPDKACNNLVRFDTGNEFNKDNIVEVGP